MNQTSKSSKSSKSRCVFCDIPFAESIFENQDFIVVQDINPVDNTHLLIIPKRHIKNYQDDLTSSAQAYAIVRHLIEFFELKDYKIIENAGLYQEISHAHLHLISPVSVDQINNLVKTKS